LIAEGKTVVLITCTIHATEIASTHTAVEFAYKMATAADSKSLGILNNTIIMLVPSLNPDGLDIVTKWYRSTLNTPYEGTSPPELYQKYTGHDNNRD
ncbi:M14 family zinc carboxypeptidase, partial [Staphylococcus aureus]